MRPCIGVVREAYSKWERRAALTPAHVARITADGVRVLVQPSPKRVFSDAEYREAGAIITEDLSPAATILGVKQPRLGSLLPNHTHMFFSHTIKGQPESMPLLDEAIEKRVRLLDYECVRAGGRESGARLVAFGEFAGKAGLISSFRGLGLRLLSLGHSSPLLGVGPPHSYPTYFDARRALAAAGRGVAEHGLPFRYAPMVIAVVGRGNVSRGAVDAIDALNGGGSASDGVAGGGASVPRSGPVVHWVGVEDLPALSTLANTPGAHQHRVYAVLLGASDVVARSGGGPFDREEYYAHPERYQPCFHTTVAPHISMLVTTMYWDRRFPRLLTAAQLRGLGPDETRRLLMIADLTCDVDGAVEALTRTSTVDEPFYMCDAAAGREGPRGVDGPGVVMLGVDILPAELPRESSAHFGNCLMPFIGALARCHHTPVAAALPPAAAAAAALPPELEAATITSGGQLTRRYEYIAGMRRLAQRNNSAAHAQAVLGSTVLSLCGHLFDSGLINRALDVVEAAGASFDLLDVQVRPNSSVVQAREGAHTSTALLQVTIDGGRPRLEALIADLRALAAATPTADATVDEMPPEYCGGVYERTIRQHYGALSAAPAQNESAAAAPAPPAQMVSPGVLHATSRESPPPAADRPPRRVLVLGAGLVAAPAVEYLSRRPSDTVELVSALPGEAEAMASRLGRRNVRGATLSACPTAGSDWARVCSLVRRSDAVLSLLPAAMHAAVGRACIDGRVPLVTASYVSPEMAQLHSDAARWGVPLLCEMGLDPGIDHMSARAMIDAAVAEGGVVNGFTSVCGGLPAPEAAADNPFGYKFSWSPAGVLAAADNGARYLSDGKVTKVARGGLLGAAAPLLGSQLGRVMRLEVLPNRDALEYRQQYGLDSPSLHTLFRGTLRYRGFSSLLGSLTTLGLTDGSRAVPAGVSNWPDLLHHMDLCAPAPPAAGASLAGARSDGDDRAKTHAVAFSALEWLGALDPSTPVVLPPAGGSVRDAMCSLLSLRLAYGPTERDAVLMEHQLRVDYPEPLPGSHAVGETRRSRVLTSTLVEYGTPGGTSAMARTVGLAAAVGVACVLDSASAGAGERALPGGVLRPTLPAVYRYALPRLAEEGLHFNETAREMDETDERGVYVPKEEVGASVGVGAAA